MKIFILFLLKISGVFLMARYLCRNKIIIFSLHGVMDEKEKSLWHPLRGQVSRAKFDEALSVLSKHYNFISLDDAVSMLNGNKKLKPFSVVLTFDDGYKNNMTHALPVLQKYNVPATFFLATGYIDKKKPFWFDRLDYALQHGNVHKKKVTIAGNSVVIDSSSRSALGRSYYKIRILAKKAVRNDSEMVSEMEGLAEKIEKESGNSLSDIYKGDPWSEVLSWDDVRIYSKVEGVTFGSHTVEHVRVALVSDEVAREEVKKSKESIEAHTGKECRNFCYPIGSFDQTSAQIVRNAGYTSAVTTVPKMNIKGVDLMQLHRFSLPAGRHPLRILALTCNLNQVISWFGVRVRKVLN